MVVGGGAIDDECMTPDDDTVHRRDDRNRDELAIRRLLRDMTEEQQRLERRPRAVAAAEKDTKDVIEGPWRTEHRGHEPLRPQPWRRPSDAADVPPPRPTLLHDHAARNAAVLSFATAIVLILAAYIVRFEVGAAMQKVILGAVALGAIATAAVVHHRSIPTRQLPRHAKLRREQRHRAALTGVLGAVLVVEVYAAAFDLNSWAEWTVCAGFALTAVGAAIAVQTRLA
jgi:hypothetical protein